MGNKDDLLVEYKNQTEELKNTLNDELKNIEIDVLQKMDKEVPTLSKESKENNLEMPKDKSIQDESPLITSKYFAINADKAESFFQANKGILKYIGCRSKKSIGVMYFLMIPAMLLFLISQILLYPITFAWLIIDHVILVIKNVCGSIQSLGWKIVAGILVTLILLGLLACIYYGLARLVGI